MKSSKLLFRNILLFTVVFFFAFDELSRAQTTNETYRHISSKDGLSSGFVWDMLEDRNGFIWVATNTGLDKYDGYSVTNYRNDPSDPNSITPGQVFSIIEDYSGMIWVGTAAGLGMMDPSTGLFYPVRVPRSTKPRIGVRALEQREDSSIWAGTANGLYHIPVQDYFSDTMKVELFDMDTSGEPIENILALAIDNSTMWIGTDSTFHKFDLDTKEFIPLPPFDEAVNKVLSSSIWALLVDSKGTLWINATAGIVAWRKGEDKPEAIAELGPYNKADLAGASFQSLTEDEAGRLWIGTDPLGAIRLDLDTGEVKTYRHNDSNVNSMREDDVHYAFVDSEGNTWFGYHNFGMSLMYSHSWKYDLKYASDDHAPEHPINSIRNMKEDAAGNLWFATHQGLVLRPADGSPLKNFVPFTENVSSEGLENRMGFMHITDDQIVAESISDEASLFIFDIQSETFDKINIPDSLNSALIGFAVTEKYFYIGSLTRRLVLIDRSIYEFHTIDVPSRETDDFNIKPVLPMMDSEGNILIQSIHIYPAESKLEWDSFIFDPTDESFTLADIQSPPNILAQPFPSIASNREPGIVWSLTNIGLLREDYLNGESQLYFEDEAVILNENQSFLYEDNAGYIWLGASSGITKLDPATETLTYYEADQSRMPSPFTRSYQLSNGDLVFPGRGGYIQFNPNELTTDESIQNVHITELWTGSDIYPILSSDRTHRYELEHANNNISIAFLGLNYRDPNFTRYRYRLNGYDNEWNSVGTQRRIFLANLPPGDYTFQVQAATRYGGYGENMDEIQIAILPPWWRTIPAYITYALLLIGGVITIDRVQRKRVLSKERERSREKELAQAKEIEKAYENLKAAQDQLVQQEKLASLGQLTAGIAHEIKNPLNFVTNFSDVSIELVEEAREEVKKEQAEGYCKNREVLALLDDIEANLRKIHEHGSRADSIVKSMLLHSRGKSGEKIPTDLNKVLEEYLNLAFHGMRATNKSFNIDMQTDYDPNIPTMDLVAQDLSRAFLNIINNAMYAVHEYSNSQSDLKPVIRVSTKKQENNVEIRIKDNGPGIPYDIRERIFEPFFTTKPTGEGTGLGLSMTYDIIKLHQGTLEVDSKHGEYTEFIISLPITETQKS